MRFYLICSCFNVLFLLYMFYGVYKEQGFIKYSGAAFFTLFGIVLGPAFTCLLFVIKLLMLVDKEYDNDYTRKIG